MVNLLKKIGLWSIQVLIVKKKEEKTKRRRKDKKIFNYNKCKLAVMFLNMSEAALLKDDIFFKFLIS